MFIAHLPAGYLVVKGIWAGCHAHRRQLSWRVFCGLGLLGSVAPDFDLFYFFLIDHGQHNHHSYYSHIPLFWLVTLGMLTAVFYLPRYRRLLPYVAIFALNIFVHLLLDSLVGGILWLYPWQQDLHPLLVIANTEQHWWLNFIWHWTFILELLVIYAAANVYARSSSTPAPDYPVIPVSVQTVQAD